MITLIIYIFFSFIASVELRLDPDGGAWKSTKTFIKCLLFGWLILPMEFGAHIDRSTKK
jgi:hypothetical protein